MSEPVNRGEVMAFLVNQWIKIGKGAPISRAGALQLMGTHALICEYRDADKRREVARECVGHFRERSAEMIAH